MAKTISISAKCSDMFDAQLLQDGKQIGECSGYVPDWFPNPHAQHFGDYVTLTIDVETGHILNWKKPSQAKLDETFDDEPTGA